MEQRTCKRSGCNNTFETYASRDKQYCSRSCSTKSQWEEADEKEVQEWREKISKGVQEADYEPAAYWKGKSLPEKTRKKMSEAHKGKEKSEEHLKKISESLKQNEEHIERLKSYDKTKPPHSGSTSELEKEVLKEVRNLIDGKVKHWKRVSGYYPDITCEGLDLIIEVQGDYWHANPEQFDADDEILWRREQVKAEEIWKKDEKRAKELEEKGYEIFVIWESEWKQNKEKVLDSISDRVKEL